ncbi:hypothetical protein LAZ67_23000036 [Cordylochernes scorpioides]|uniref:Uncharacterized protein n=1 Tax=Cordylochernes scorpioides TaxID=51811 RepID=A0ABY6LUE9_9ARAC|nr:hypothetical protein LAZ67_23000036 [Cordylochernes scorpioides]
MVFRNGGKVARSKRWYWGQSPLSVTSKYTYLGYPLTPSISFTQVALNYRGRTMAAMGAVGEIILKSKLKSFHAMKKLTLKFWTRILKMDGSRLPSICLAHLWDISISSKQNIGLVSKGEQNFQPFRHPSVFSGEPGQNPKKWLKEFHRVARYNHWDNTMCLANVYFSFREQQEAGSRISRNR